MNISEILTTFADLGIIYFLCFGPLFLMFFILHVRRLLQQTQPTAPELPHHGCAAAGVLVILGSIGAYCGRSFDQALGSRQLTPFMMLLALGLPLLMFIRRR